MPLDLSPAAHALTALFGVGDIAAEDIRHGAQKERGVAGHPWHLCEPFGVGVQHSRKPSEGVDERVRDLVRVAHGHEMKEDILEYLVVAERPEPALLYPLAHTVAVSVVCTHSLPSPRGFLRDTHIIPHFARRRKAARAFRVRVKTAAARAFAY